MVLYGDTQNPLEAFFNKSEFSSDETQLSACIGFFNLRGWNELSEIVKFKSGRILVGLPRNDFQEAIDRLQFLQAETLITNKLALETKQQYIKSLSAQLRVGAPSLEEKETLKNLNGLIETGQVQIKLYTKSRLHAKLYILKHNEINQALIGSSNLTYSGINGVGELNTDLVADIESASDWFEEKWNSEFSIDISLDLKEELAKSWASEDIIDPFVAYLKLMYHLSRDARQGLVDFSIPKILERDLLDFQKNAIEIATKYLRIWNGVMIGDAVGFGKTIEAIGIAALHQQQKDWTTLILCPPKLVEMWNKYLEKYEVFGRVEALSAPLVEKIDELRRFNLVIIDESHNLRTGKRNEYQKIIDYVKRNESKVVLLTATPYNKGFSDVFNQLYLFQDPRTDIGYKPVKSINEIGQENLITSTDGELTTINAFEKAIKKTENEEDMRSLMSNFLIRRTRKFLSENYSLKDDNGKSYFKFANGSKHYIPERLPIVIKSKEKEFSKSETYLRSDEMLDNINQLILPRYKLSDYIDQRFDLKSIKNNDLKEYLEGVLSLGGNVYNFNKTLLYKRLSSSDIAFLISLDRRLKSDKFWIYCLENKLDIPTGSIDSNLIDEIDIYENELENIQNDEWSTMYKLIQEKQPSWLKAWVPVDIFTKNLIDDIKLDIAVAEEILKKSKNLNINDDSKIKRLCEQIDQSDNKKILIFSEYKDTVNHIYEKIQSAFPNKKISTVSGETSNPQIITERFSPVSNEVSVSKEDEIDILISTDSLSEGQNLQDSNIVINYDLPWTIIRIIQRAGRVDRIGQQEDNVFIYTFEPDEGIESILNLRSRIKDRLIQNQQVFGSDEKFFGDEIEKEAISAIYSGNLELLENLQDKNSDVDIVSEAYSVWQKYESEEPELCELAKKMPNLIYTSKFKDPDGAMVYLQSDRDIFIKSFTDKNGQTITEPISPKLAIEELKTEPHEKGYKIPDKTYEYVKNCYKYVLENQNNSSFTIMNTISKKIYNILSENIKELNEENEGVEGLIQNIVDQTLTETAKSHLSKFIKKPKPVDLYREIKFLEESEVLFMNKKNTKSKSAEVIISFSTE